MNKKRIAVLASGNGTNAEEIIRYFSGHNSIEVALLLSNNPKAYALTRAANHGIPARVFNRTQFYESTEVLKWLVDEKITHIVLAGFLWLIPTYLIEAFPERIINIHPALLPRFGGKGMFGMKVHEAVRDSGSKSSGITIHLVNEHYDEGAVLFQCECELEENCTAEAIAEKVHALEYAHYPRVIEKWILEGN